jgi:hypothetical protein
MPFLTWIVLGLIAAFSFSLRTVRAQARKVKVLIAHKGG